MSVKAIQNISRDFFRTESEYQMTAIEEERNLTINLSNTISDLASQIPERMHGDLESWRRINASLRKLSLILIDELSNGIPF